MLTFHIGNDLCEEPWRREMPQQIHRRVVPPALVNQEVDDMSWGSRIIGFSPDGIPCYCHYSYTLQRVYSDDDDFHYAASSLVYHSWGWLLQSGQWLTCRRDLFSPEYSARTFPRYAEVSAMPR